MAVASIGRDTRILAVGQLVTLVPKTAIEDGIVEEEYPSRIEDLLEDALVVSMPMRRRALVAIPRDTTVTVFFNRGGARYCLDASVVGYNSASFPVLYLASLGKIKRIERRVHARVSVLLEPIHVDFVDETPEEAEARGTDSIVVVNLSAGGLGLVCSHSLAAESRLRISMDLPRGFGRIESMARVVRSSKLDAAGGVRKWQAGIEFMELGDKQRDRLAAFVLYQEQTLRRKGLL